MDYQKIQQILKDREECERKIAQLENTSVVFQLCTNGSVKDEANDCVTVDESMRVSILVFMKERLGKIDAALVQCGITLTK